MPITAEDVLDLAKSSGSRFIRFLYCDLSSIVRGKTTHVDRLQNRLDSGIGLVKGTLAMNMLDQMSTDTGLGAIGEVRLVPDLSTFVTLPYAPSSSALLCDLLSLDRQAWSLCPRNLLKRQLTKAQDQGIFFQAAFEPEFMLSTMENGSISPIDQSLCFSTDGMNKANTFIVDFASALEIQNIEIEQYYPELGHGQHELSITHTPALQAADRHIWYRETLKGVAAQQNVKATLAPKPFRDRPGNGCHLHLSAWDSQSQTNLFYANDGISDFALSFIAGLLEHLPALVAILCPSVNSYRRLQPSAWSSAFTCWGYENREAAIRIPSVYWNNESASTNIEIKCVDSTCNPYLALAAIIACGIDGVDKKLTPPLPIDCDPATLSKDQLKERRIRRFPSSLKEALLELESNSFLCKVLGQEMFNSFLSVKRSEYTAFAKKSTEFELLTHRDRF